jgi:hypothetical protein
MRLPVFALTKVVAFHESVSKGEALDSDSSTLDLYVKEPAKSLSLKCS